MSHHLAFPLCRYVSAPTPVPPSLSLLKKSDENMKLLLFLLSFVTLEYTWSMRRFMKYKIYEIWNFYE